ncbi:MAG: ABC transporter ATP-binding protein [Candidatus Dormibacteraeota bacterium]|nr:ABC transporter ATP-binding protein [Candidatus Dormibacteraeota bacterium]
MLVADFELDRREFPVRIDLRVPRGERVALLGRSGAGKTSTLEALAGLLSLSRGEIHLGERRLSSAAAPGADLPPGRRGVGLLRQTPGLFPHLTVLENIGYAKGVAPEVARATGERLGLGSLLGVRPRGLSGGEAQRVALARALQTKADVLCLDEPFNSLDRPLGLELLDLLRRELESSATAAVLVTHRLDEAQAFAHRVAVLHRGRILQVGDPRELVLRPASLEVSELVGYQGWLVSGSQTMAVHPDLVHPVELAAEGELLARVVGAIPQGARIELELEAEGRWRGRFRCRSERSAAVGELMRFAAPGAPVYETGVDRDGG